MRAESLNMNKKHTVLSLSPKKELIKSVYKKKIFRALTDYPIH